MLATPMDNLNFANDPEIKAMIGHEDIYFSDKIIKIHSGIFNSRQERNILITNLAFYNLKGKEKKRKIEISDLTGVTISSQTDDFIIHGKDEEYDYLLSTPNRFKFIEILETVHESATNTELLFAIKNEKDLTKYIVGKKERKKDKGLYKLEGKDLMSIREFIESGGSFNINTHANSLKLEKYFRDNDNFKNEDLSNFEILSVIGKGKTSIVYLANYEGRKVALKVFDKVYLYKNYLIDKLILEKNILSLFPDEKFICQMEFYFFTTNKVVFVLPFYPGGDLFSLLRKSEKLDETTAAFYSAQICHMIGILHSKNIVYRDLKLENIMVNENGYLTLIDFGSCKIIEDSTELESSFEGSLDYLSPEMVTGSGVTFSTDWWSFGILLYELLYGLPPFYDEKIERVLELITSANVRFPSRIKLTQAAKNLISVLLDKNQFRRLGMKGQNEILNHPFFESINMKNVLIQKTVAPNKPNCDSNNPLINFDNSVTCLPIGKFDVATDMSIINNFETAFEEQNKI